MKNNSDKNTLAQNIEGRWKDIKDILSNTKRYQRVRDLVKEMRPNEIAALIHYLDAPLREKLIKVLKSELDPDVFVFLDQSVREDIVSMISVQHIASILKVFKRFFS